MKPPNRIHQKHVAKAVKSQVKTPQLQTVTVVFESEVDGKEMFRVELPEILVAAVHRAAQKMKITTGRFFELAIAHKVNQKNSIPVTGGGQ